MKASPQKISLLVILLILLVGGQTVKTIQASPMANSVKSSSLSKSLSPKGVSEYQVPDWARLVDISTVNPSIVLDMRYATANNFLNRKMYSVARCALRASVAEKLSRVQEELQQMGLGLKVYDCYRPLSVTQQMWDVLPDPRYVANPARGSRHNRGAAVDLTLIDQYGTELEMPTDFDDFTERAARDYRGSDVSDRARRNSQILEDVMTKHGFVPLVTEWWHFDAENWQQFSLLDVSLKAIP